MRKLNSKIKFGKSGFKKNGRVRLDHPRLLSSPFFWSLLFNPAVLLDIQGPKIRTGSFKEGSIMLEQGKEYVLTTDESVKSTGDEKQFYVDYEVRREGGREGRKE
jgi:hypothetical protein